MPSRANFGFSSFVFGALAIPIEAVVPHLQSTRNPGSAVFLEALDRVGLVRSGVPNSTHELRPSPILTFTDESVLIMLQVFGAYLAVAALVFGYWAELRRENSLFLSGGLVCGSLALLLLNTAFGFWSMAASAVVVTVLRRRTDA